MRSILVDWLVEVGQEYRLTSDTLFLTVNLLDRFLSLHVVSRDELQLAGIACMWLAAKYEEIYAPSANNFCYITDNTYTECQLVKMEALVLSTLGFKLTVPTAKIFLRRCLQAAAADERLHYLASYLCEITLLQDGMLHFLPSQIAAASVYLAQLMLEMQPAWDATLQHYSGYSVQQLGVCVEAMWQLHKQVTEEHQFNSIPEKYANAKLCCVSQIPALQVLPCASS